MGLIPGSTRGVIVFLLIFTIGSAPFVSSSLYSDIVSSQSEMSQTMQHDVTDLSTPYNMSIPLIGDFEVPVIGSILKTISLVFTMIKDAFVITASYALIMLSLGGILPIEVAIPLMLILSLGLIFGTIRLIWGNE